MTDLFAIGRMKRKYSTTYQRGNCEAKRFV